MDEKISMAVGMASATVSFFTPDISVPYLGVPLNVVGAAVAGAFCSFAFGAAVRPRARLFKLAAACAVLGCAFIAVLDLFNIAVATDKQAPLALVFSAVMRWVVPAFQQAVPEAMKEWLTPKKRSRWEDDYGDDRDASSRSQQDDNRFD